MYIYIYRTLASFGKSISISKNSWWLSDDEIFVERKKRKRKMKIDINIFRSLFLFFFNYFIRTKPLSFRGKPNIDKNFAIGIFLFFFFWTDTTVSAFFLVDSRPG